MSAKKKSVYIYAFEWLVLLSISLMVGSVFINACLRYFFHTAFTQSEELARFLFLIVIFLGAIIAYKEGHHVKMDVISKILKGKPEKAVRIISKIIELGVIVFLFYSGIEYTKQASTYSTAATGINFGLIAVFLPIMALGMLLVEVGRLITVIRLQHNSKAHGGD